MCAACCVQSVSVFCLYFCQIRNPTVHLYLVVDRMSSKMLALLGRGYSDKTLILNENNSLLSCQVCDCCSAVTVQPPQELVLGPRMTLDFHFQIHSESF